MYCTKVAYFYGFDKSFMVFDKINFKHNQY